MKGLFNQIIYLLKIMGIAGNLFPKYGMVFLSFPFVENVGNALFFSFPSYIWNTS